jgi:hypothetical protein
LLGSKGGKVLEGRQGKGVEMTQTMYAHVNKRKIIKKKKN